MDKRILRLPEMMNRLGLSRSAIYDRMDKKSDRYDPTFPKKTRLGDRQGSAIGWYEVDVDAWLASRPEDTQAVASRRAAKPSPIPPKPKTLPAESTPSQVPSNRAVSIAGRDLQQSQPAFTDEQLSEWASQNAYLIECLRLDAWTPVMGALLASGIKAPQDCSEIPLGGEGVDGQPLHASDARFHRARSILKKWNAQNIEYDDDDVPRCTYTLPGTITPVEFFIWCDEEQIDSDWLRLIREIAGCPIPDGLRHIPTSVALQLYESKPVAKDLEDKEQRRQRLLKRKNELKNAKCHNFLDIIAKEEKLSKSRIKQLLNDPKKPRESATGRIH